jgi:mono/diheme cytochrome c family protein
VTLYHESEMRLPSLVGSCLLLTPVLGLAGVLAVAVAGCRSLPPSKPAELWTPEEARGAQIYQVKCARCHYPTTTQGLHGPGLQALTKIKAMPSGAPPTDERLTQAIVGGRLEMPATPLTDGQLSDLLAYLHTL